METDYRISGRISTFATVSYSSFDDDEQCTISGMIVDVSDAGVGIYTNTPVADDTIIAVCCTDLWDEVKAARVVFCKETGKDIFRIGISFL